MSLLAIDIGNTHTVLGVFSAEGTLLRSFRIQTLRQNTADEIDVCVRTMLAPHEGVFAGVDIAAVASVVPELNDVWRAALSGWASLKQFVVLECRIPWSFSVQVPDPFQVGADRLADVEAALTRARKPAIIVDAGTGTTFDVVLEHQGNFAYVGGAIAPGVGIALEALVSRASRLRAIALRGPAAEKIPVVGNTTESALRSGVVHGFAGMVDDMVRRIVAERCLAPELRVIATGGFCELLRGYSSTVTEYAPELTLEGIYAIAKQL